jgi:GAF domain-containing protein
MVPVPVDEEGRLAALADCGVLDTEPEEVFDRLVSLAASLVGMPIALVSFIEFKARVGLERAQTTRDESFCNRLIVSREPLVVCDASTDVRFSENPLVTGPPFIRFYAGVPLVSVDGHVLGSLCVIDSAPHQVPEAQLGTLGLLA